ncbi:MULTISPECIES: MFS transporter [Kitasatospora]|uniref:Putative major facilitator superfamily transporter n=1 Tax=Kitasatospora setae (strain ATCC 33774 / DSM 43861 / JCM 3304 / KCC A-0304 / NBRC 14216 / KM-6054) TaxID=452652 RepID=E4N640_KITSK|nr:MULTISPECIES: MFS transporter [Kitasatospora]BAJ26671.1 putative major facilitator superfamily transporter [Kitasatospora setae KM-6054]
MSTTSTDRPLRAPAAAPASAFWRYWAASTTSGLGDCVTQIALPLTAVTVLHASGLQVGLVTAAGYVAWLVIGLPAGVLVQRLPLRGTQIAMDLARAAAIASVPLAAAFGVLGLPQLVAAALVLSFASVVFDVGNATFLPSVVPPGQLTARNSLTSATHAVNQLAGPSLGGLLVQLLGAATALVVDAVSFLCSAALLRTLPRSAAERPAPAADRPSFGAQIREGWRYCTRHPVVGPCLAEATCVNFVCGALMAVIPLFLVRTAHAPAGLVGLLMAAEGVGSLVGAALTPRLAARLGTARALRYGSLFGVLTAPLMALAPGGPGLLLFALGNAGFGASVVVLSILTRTHRQSTTPAALLPRVMATVRFVSWGAIPVGALAAGAAASLWGPRTALALACALTALSPALLFASKLRGARDLTDVAA